MTDIDKSVMIELLRLQREQTTIFELRQEILQIEGRAEYEIAEDAARELYRVTDARIDEIRNAIIAEGENLAQRAAELAHAEVLPAEPVTDPEDG